MKKQTKSYIHFITGKIKKHPGKDVFLFGIVAVPIADKENLSSLF